MATIIHFDQSAIVARIDKRFKTVLPILTEEILNDCNQYVKWDTGMLAQSSYIHTDFKNGIMRWQTPYARRQYWEIQTNLSGDPKRTWKWVHMAKGQLMDKWTRQAAKLMGVNK